MQTWQRNFRGCRQQKKEGAAMLRKQEIAAWRPHDSKLLPSMLQWEQIRSMPWPMLLFKVQGKWSSSRCQEEMQEKEIVKMNESKVEPVSKWHCPRQAG